jgi:hypothetical protein
MASLAPRPGVSRRAFVLGTASGLLAGGGLGLLGRRAFHGQSREVPRPTHAMPGPYPGRVVEIHHPDSVGSDYSIDAPTVRSMMHQGMCALTGAEHPSEAWRRFFERGDVVGVKVNPVGHSGRRDLIGCISSPAVVVEVVAGLRSAGVRARDIILFERYASEFRQAGYDRLLREPGLEGVRWLASASDGGNRQVDIEGYDVGGPRDPNVVGYDPDVFVSMGFCHPDHDRHDDRRFRSHLSLIVSRLVNKFVTIPCLKDHRSAGVTLALKNMSHGMNNNVARTHLADVYRYSSRSRRLIGSGPNQCNTFIPTAAGQEPIRQKATLHILDGLIGVYEGGPGCWNRTWAAWPYRSLFFATDPVAMDHVGWDVIDRKRQAEGWRHVAHMGLLDQTPAARIAGALGPLAASCPTESVTLTAALDHREGGRHSEAFDRRQPEHVILAGTAGLGTFDARSIDHRAYAWGHGRWVNQPGGRPV